MTYNMEQWEQELKSRKDISDISHDIGYGLSNDDLRILARLHKKGTSRVRNRIEDLLTNLNFHSECSKFASGMYFFNDREQLEEILNVIDNIIGYRNKNLTKSQYEDLCYCAESLEMYVNNHKEVCK